MSSPPSGTPGNFTTFGEWMAAPLPPFPAQDPSETDVHPPGEYTASKSVSAWAAANFQGVTLAPETTLQDNRVFRAVLESFIKWRDTYEPEEDANPASPPNRVPWMEIPKDQAQPTVYPRNEADTIAAVNRCAIEPISMVLDKLIKSDHPGRPNFSIPLTGRFSVPGTSSRLTLEVLREASIYIVLPKIEEPPKLPGPGETDVGAGVHLPVPRASSAKKGSAETSASAEDELRWLRVDILFAATYFPPILKALANQRKYLPLGKLWDDPNDLANTHKCLPKSVCPVELKMVGRLDRAGFKYLADNKIAISGPTNGLLDLVGQGLNAQQKYVRKQARDAREYLQQGSTYKDTLGTEIVILWDYKNLLILLIPPSNSGKEQQIQWVLIEAEEQVGYQPKESGKLSAKEALVAFLLAGCIQIQEEIWPPAPPPEPRRSTRKVPGSTK